MFAWRNQVRGDRDVTNFQVRVADALAECVYYTSGCAEVSQAEILRQVGRGTRRGLQKALRALAGRGHLRIEDFSHAGRFNRYWPLLEGADLGSHLSYEPEFAGTANAGSPQVRMAIRTNPLSTSDTAPDVSPDAAVLQQQGDAQPSDTAFNLARQVAAIVSPGDPTKWPASQATLRQASKIAESWLRLGLSATDCLAIVRGAMAKKRGGPPRSMRYFSPAIESYVAEIEGYAARIAELMNNGPAKVA